jgi:hypothetical protein
VVLRFEDGTVVRLKGAPEGSGAVPHGGTVTQAFQDGRRLEIHFENGQSVVVRLEEPADSVSVSDTTGEVLYVDYPFSDALKGRVVAEFENENGTLVLRFEDGTVLRLKGKSAGSGAVPHGGVVAQASEHGRGVEISFEDGQSAIVWLEESGNSISVHDAAGEVLYVS